VCVSRGGANAPSPNLQYFQAYDITRTTFLWSPSSSMVSHMYTSVPTPPILPFQFQSGDPKHGHTDNFGDFPTFTLVSWFLYGPNWQAGLQSQTQMGVITSKDRPHFLSAQLCFHIFLLIFFFFLSLGVLSGRGLVNRNPFVFSSAAY
jgi:hypothetical protein